MAVRVACTALGRSGQGLPARRQGAGQAGAYRLSRRRRTRRDHGPRRLDLDFNLAAPPPRPTPTRRPLGPPYAPTGLDYRTSGSHDVDPPARPVLSAPHLAGERARPLSTLLGPPRARTDHPRAARRYVAPPRHLALLPLGPELDDDAPGLPASRRAGRQSARAGCVLAVGRLAVRRTARRPFSRRVAHALHLNLDPSRRYARPSLCVLSLPLALPDRPRS